MSRNALVLLVIALLTVPLIFLFIPDAPPGRLDTLQGVMLSTVQGEKFKFSGMFTDKKILLVFWSITCSSCIEEIPFIIRLHEKLKDRLTIIGVHPPGFPLTKVQKFIKRYPQPIPYLLAIDDEMKLIRTYEATILPKTVLLNRKGEVLYAHVGYEPGQDDEIERAIREKL
ncbi:MAG: hypothetical protein OZSIB_2677 [Candidatus Ozemobacter sibiricus]|jgi:thiol-disulfide isomerase/thioredoxin|uniref:Thioredoxin domain-containing protein n=1 Tax=Candidatus Ozemobacter sibiricus TaxID=2268124 RepID=A0A367ZSU9_9BACT|nr:MAG: hypothetical protein OZSIB_2677 [Candidatus Ozemobacter sibiricus]